MNPLSSVNSFRRLLLLPRRPLLLQLLELLLLVGLVRSRDLDQCRTSLGMQTGNITDEQITASSSLHQLNLGPASARIRSETRGGAWCPDKPVSKDVYEYLQIDFKELKIITLVETQGRFGHGQGQEFTDQYLLEYQREEGGRWFRFRNRRSQEIFQGNTNTYISELRELEPSIIARLVRFVPYSAHPKSICLRVELYGCTWTDGVVSYSMPQGERRGAEVDLFDLTYDGSVQGNFLSGGLGQLTDGVEGQSNFRLDPNGLGFKGYEWVGWRNDSFNGRPVEIFFKFDSLRNFTQLRIHSNNMFNKDTRVFSFLKAFFYMTLPAENDVTPQLGFHDVTSSTTLDYRYTRDSVMEYARDVIVSLSHNVGRYVRLELYFDAKWMLISEIEFESDYAIVLPPTSAPASTAALPRIKTDKSKPGIDLASISNDIIDLSRTVSGVSGGPGGVEIPAGSSKDGNRSNRTGVQRSSSSPSSTSTVRDKDTIRKTKPEIVAGVVTELTDQRDKELEASRKRPDDDWIGIIIGTLTGLILLITGLVTMLILRQRGYLSTCDASSNLNKPVLISVAPVSLCNDGIIHPTPYRQPVYANEVLTTSERQKFALQDLREDPDTSKTNGELLDHEPSSLIQQRIAEPTSRISASHTLRINRPLPLRPNANSKLSNCATLSYQRTRQTIASGDHQLPVVSKTGAINNNMTSTNYRNSGGLRPTGVEHFDWLANPLVMTHQAVVKAAPQPVVLGAFPREALTFVRSLGEGQFGEVFLCEAKLSDDGSEEYFGSSVAAKRLESDNSLDDVDSRTMMVAVKTLKSNASENIRQAFAKELAILASLRDANIARGVGVCEPSHDGQPWGVVIEYGCHGNLKEYLLSHLEGGSDTDDDDVSSGDVDGSKQINGKQTTSGTKKSLSYGCLVSMATQIASGLKYLTSLNIVHRDLAARNCLVCSNNEIKISDLGVSHHAYPSEYCQVARGRNKSSGGGRALVPIRWMSWEALLLSEYTVHSDVWSFAVTVWEILTLAAERPLPHLTDEQIVENATHFYGADNLAVVPSRPPSCPREIYDLLAQCWLRDPHQRPNVNEIHMFLEQKLAGYRRWDNDVGGGEGGWGRPQVLSI